MSGCTLVTFEGLERESELASLLKEAAEAGLNYELEIFIYYQNPSDSNDPISVEIIYNPEDFMIGEKIENLEQKVFDALEAAYQTHCISSGKQPRELILT